MPRAQDIFGRFAQPRALTAKAASFGNVAGGAGRDTTAEALYSGAAYYDGASVYGDGGRITYDGTATYNGRNQYYIPA